MNIRTQVVVAVSVISFILPLSACSSFSEAGKNSPTQSSSQPDASYDAQLQQALQSATSDFERTVLKRAIDAGKISESDYREANERYQQCMVSKGDNIEFTTDQSTGLMQESMSADDGYDSEKVTADSMECARGTNLLIRDLYERMATNPTNADEIELIVDCLKRKKIVPQSFTKQDYLTESAKPQGSSQLDTSSNEFAQCLANPNK